MSQCPTCRPTSDARQRSCRPQNKTGTCHVGLNLTKTDFWRMLASPSIRFIGVHSRSYILSARHEGRIRDGCRRRSVVHPSRRSTLTLTDLCMAAKNEGYDLGEFRKGWSVIVSPVVISRKLSKIDPQLLRDTIRKMASLIGEILSHADAHWGDIWVSNIKYVQIFNTASCSTLASDHSCCKPSTTVVSHSCCSDSTVINEVPRWNPLFTITLLC